MYRFIANTGQINELVALAVMVCPTGKGSVFDSFIRINIEVDNVALGKIRHLLVRGCKFRITCQLSKPKETEKC